MPKTIYNLKEKKEKRKKRFSFCPTVSAIGHIELQTHIQDWICVYILTGPVITAIEQSSTQKKKKGPRFWNGETSLWVGPAGCVQTTDKRKWKRKKTSRLPKKKKKRLWLVGYIIYFNEA